MSYSRLENKEKIILNLTVASYLETGKPVSSGLLAQKLNFRISPATIRNAMASLEQQGYLYQPHTSAGRLPTDEGIRFYVNTLLTETLRATPDELRIYPEELSVGSGELDSLLLQVSQILASSLIIWPLSSHPISRGWPSTRSGLLNSKITGL